MSNVKKDYEGELTDGIEAAEERFQEKALQDALAKAVDQRILEQIHEKSASVVVVPNDVIPVLIEILNLASNLLTQRRIKAFTAKTKKGKKK